MINLLFFLLIFLSGCASIDSSVQAVRYNEVLGIGYEHLDGKLFRIICKGNEEASAEFVESRCLENLSEFSFKEGYEYFSVISENNAVTQEVNAVVVSGIAIPYTDTMHQKKYHFVLVNSDELCLYKTFYKVSDYYPPKKETP